MAKGATVVYYSRDVWELTIYPVLYCCACVAIQTASDV